MKLQKAKERSVSYPNKEGIKPILLSVTVAVALSACSHPIDPLGGAKPPVTEQSTKRVHENMNETNGSNTINDKIIEPEVLGGIPMPPPNY